MTGPGVVRQLTEDALEVEPVWLDQAMAEQVQPQVGVLSVLGSGVEVDDHAHHLRGDVAQVVRELGCQQRLGGLPGDLTADSWFRVEHVENGTGGVNGGEAPAPALARNVSHAGKCSEHGRQRSRDRSKVQR